MSYEDWFRQDRLPHIYCAGCGNGTIINCTLSAVDSMDWKKEDTVFVSGNRVFITSPGVHRYRFPSYDPWQSISFCDRSKNGKPQTPRHCLYR